MDLREVFGADLRRLRHAKGLSQDELAYEAEVSRSYLSQVEKGAFFTSLKIIGCLAQALNVEPAELLEVHGSGVDKQADEVWSAPHEGRPGIKGQFSNGERRPNESGAFAADSSSFR